MRKPMAAVFMAGAVLMCTACSRPDNDAPAPTDAASGQNETEIHTEESFNGIGKGDEEDTDAEEEGLKSGNITADEALLLIEEEYGENGGKDSKTGNERSYVYEDIQTADGVKYYNFRYSWIVYNENGSADHISQLGNIFVATDGSAVQFAEKTDNGWKLSNKRPEVLDIFQMQPGAQKDTACTLILNTDYTFQFSYNPYSSYLPYGKFETDNKKITCSTIDGKQTFVFDIVDDGTITFNAKESSPLEDASDEFACPTNGSVFKKASQ